MRVLLLFCIGVQAFGQCPALTINPVPNPFRAHVGFNVDFRAAANRVSCGIFNWRKISGPAGFQIDGAGGQFYFTPLGTERGTWPTVIELREYGNGTSQPPTMTAQASFSIWVDDNTFVYPMNRDYLRDSNNVAITGRVWDAGVTSWQIFVRLGTNDTAITSVLPPTGTNTQLLANWNISALPNGTRRSLVLRTAYTDGSSSYMICPLILDRTLKWSKRIGPLTHSVVCADLDGDSRSEVLAWTHFGELYCWDISGVLRWRVGLNPTTGLGAAYSGLSVGDITGDGHPDILFATILGLYAVDRNGVSVATPVPTLTGTEFRSTPTLVDLDGDGRLDVVQSYRANTTSAFGGVRAFRWVNGQLVQVWQRPFMNWSSYSSASYADLDGDNLPELVIASYDRIYAFRALDGSPYAPLNGALLPVPITGANVNGAGSPISASKVSIADLDGDGLLELIAGLNVLRRDGSTFWLATNTLPRSLSAAVGDLDFDGRPEVVIGPKTFHWNGAQLVRSSPSMGSPIIGSYGTEMLTIGSTRLATVPGVTAIELNGVTETGYPKSLFGEAGDTGAPQIGDFDSDGLVDVAVGITDSIYGGVVAIYGTTGTFDPSLQPWPMLGQDIRQSGRF